uniref:Peptidyl-prolyl cis-trans isomerase n=1 Tax=Globisporangium ultimum (strain ATCC 200006 / CBS 805.95 / DAOM BR144) TaxID=431595 RepID=K3X8H2_GLOUD
MAVNARVKYLQEFKIGLPDGPPLMYLDLRIADKPPRRLHIELFDDELPYTASNFRYLCTALWRNEGERKGNGKHRALWYKNTRFHRIIPGFMMQGGDFTHGNGAGGVSAFGRVFEDEHQRGAVSMAHQNNSNRSQFFICFGPASWCDGKHVVLGQVLADDLPHLIECEAVGSCSGLPLHPIVVADCGQLSGEGLSVTSSALPSSASNVAPL